MPATVNGLIDVRQLLRTLSVEELNRTAEDYFKDEARWDGFLTKPFNGLAEAPENLVGFAHVLHGLELTRGMTVLDFGAGPCWSSRFLAQIGCRVIASDVSPSALKIGREGFRRQPPVGALFDPQFLLFDGHHLDLPDRSVDRIMCLSAFHHVRNQQQVLREFTRVLKKGGIAGFQEPGPNHSKSAQAQAEMRQFSVIENDINLGEIWEQARGLGFTGIRVVIWNPTATMVELPAFDAFLSGAPHPAYEQAARHFLQERRLFFLYNQNEKGLPDSRQRGGLLAAIDVRFASRSVRAGTPFRASVRVKNIGEALWLPSDANVGPVRFGARLTDARGASKDFLRHPLSKADEDGIWPGQEVTFDVVLPVIAERGRYRIEFDLVSEYVTWFQANGSQTVPLDLEVG
jgi:SAM-dependent methyltransferase